MSRAGKLQNATAVRTVGMEGAERRRSFEYVKLRGDVRFENVTFSYDGEKRF